MALVLQDAVVVTLGPAGVLPHASVVVEGGVIAAVEPSPPRRSGPEVVDCRGRLILPALFNSHLHSEFLVMKGMQEERRLCEWERAPLYNRIWDTLERSRRDLLEVIYRASFLEQALGGVGFVGEFNCADDSAILSARALREVGLRGAATLKEGEARPDDPAVVVVGFVHHEGNVTREELDQVRTLMDRRPHQRFTLHCAENVERVRACEERFRCRPIHLLNQHGILRPQLLLSHAVHLTPSEIDVLATSGAAVVASLTSEMKLSDGISPLPTYVERGIPVLVGTDCATCNNGADLFSELKAVGLGQKLIHGAHVLPAEQILAMATRNAARFWGLGHSHGEIAPGRAADLTLLDHTRPSLTPLIHTADHSNVLSSLVYCASAADVTDLLIDGEFVVRGRTHVRLDAREVFGALQGAAEELLEHCAGRHIPLVDTL